MKKMIIILHLSGATLGGSNLGVNIVPYTEMGKYIASL